LGGSSRKNGFTDRDRPFRGLIAQSSYEHHQLRRHSNGPLAQTDDEPFTDFLAERRVMDVADPNVALVRAIDHDISDLLVR
jgi:hypothetical protein